MTSTETLHQCPSCGTHGFTKRGLKAHRCDGKQRNTASAAPAGEQSEQPPEATSLVVAAGTLSDDALMGQQLTAQFAKAITATRDVVVFGAMMLKARERVVSAGGRDSKGEGFKAWLETHAPEVAKSRSTAYRFMALAEGVQEEFRLGKKADLTLLLTEPADELTPSLRKKQGDILAFLEGRSQRQLLLALGGDKAPKKKVTRHEEELSAEEEMALVTERLRQDSAQLMDVLEKFTTRKWWQLWNDAELDHALTLIAGAQDAVAAWRKLPKGKRLATAVEDEIRSWKGQQQ